MKRSELVVGKEYYTSRDKDWESRGWLGRETRMLLVDAGKWEEAYSGYGARGHKEFAEIDGVETEVHARPHSGYGASTHVLGRYWDEQDSESEKASDWGRIEAIPLIRIKAPYDEAIAEIEQFDKARREANAAKKKRTDDNTRRVKAALAEFEACGLAIRTPGYNIDQGQIRVTIEELEAIVKVLP